MKLYTSAAYAATVAEYDRFMLDILEISAEVTAYILQHRPECWAQAHMKETAYGTHTSNMSGACCVPGTTYR